MVRARPDAHHVLSRARCRNDGGWDRAAEEAESASALEALLDEVHKLASKSKYSEDVQTLRYLDRRAYVRGIDELTRKLSHTMEDEWMRGDEWTDWAACAYTDHGVWEYVNGPAQSAEATPGTRDAANIGMTVDDFVERVNAHVRGRLTTEPNPSIDLLTVDEVLAVRLYTGDGQGQCHRASPRALMRGGSGPYPLPKSRSQHRSQP